MTRAPRLPPPEGEAGPEADLPPAPPSRLAAVSIVAAPPRPLALGLRSVPAPGRLHCSESFCGGAAFASRAMMGAGEAPRLAPRQLFLLGLAAAYLAAFVSLYLQVPGLYGKDGILPARKTLRFTGKGFWEQLRDSPTLLWLGPRLGLDTEQGMELLCLLGALLSFGALLLEPLRDSLVFLALWALYLSLYQVGQVFLYFQWDSLLLETGFLAVLVAPLHLLKWRLTAWRAHDGVTFWLVRWLLFRLMFASGVVKLTSRCPTWWGLTALTYHYETQCIPTPAAWFAHQLPVWLQKFSVVATYVIEIAVPPLFFAPLRRLRLFAFYCQILLQVLIIITGNYNFFNLLTIALSFSLLDDEHVGLWLGRGRRKAGAAWPSKLLSILSALAELGTYSLLVYWTTCHFGLELNWEKKLLQSKTAFTYHEFMQWLKMVTLPLVGLGLLSLVWEILQAGYRSACTRGFLWKLWSAVPWAVFSAAALGMFTISLVPFTYIEYESNGKLWPSVHRLFSAVDRYQLANSYGLFRRMTGVGGRPEVVVEGSYDKETWTEIEFLYKPGNVSAPPPVVMPYQPRLDWQMWFAALGHHTHSPWFTSFIYRLLQGKKEVIHLVQVDDSKYPFRSQPPVYIRAQLYKYWFTEGGAEDGSLPQQWWRRQRVEEFYPAVFLGDPNLDSLLAQHGLKDKAPLKRPPDSLLPTALQWVREQTRPCTGPAAIWSLYLTGAAIGLLRAVGSWLLGGGGGGGSVLSGKPKSAAKRVEPVADVGGGGDPAGSEKNGQVRKKEAAAAAERAKGTAAEPPTDGLRHVKKKK
ncbi:lipase maturation factor 2 [Hemicordylus capensis]|uniref:lipase maturation factor 2 n=1 Tax=Hemicordylus capensis TaxID=884348 RepID=UPI0023045187|nr:lipase maturation factor 2 [Hemicordylus capensis]